LIATGSHSCIDHNCFGNQYYNKAGSNTSDCVYLEQVDSWKNFGGWAYSASLNENGRALVYVDMSRGASNFAVIDGLTGEYSTYLQTYGICFSNDAFTPTGWKIDSCRLPSSAKAIYAGDLVTIDNFHISNISELSSRGLFASGTVQNSVLHTAGMLLDISKSSNNMISGRSESWSIANRHGDCWLDQGSTNKVWSANTSALTIKGTLTARAICAVYGSLVTVNIVLTATTSLVCDKGTPIAGLPFTAGDYSSDVTVTNITSQIGLSGGYVHANNLHLPAINVGTDEIVITATYFAA
jgi:hypothetical protein